MEFDVGSLTIEEVLATETLIKGMKCPHAGLACPFCSCFKFCKFLQSIVDQCEDAIELEERTIL